MRRILFILVAVSLGLYVGCSKDIHRPGSLSVSGGDLSTPHDVLNALIRAYNDRDTSLYAGLLARDYVFQYGGAGRPGSSMTREEDATSFRNMCREATEITLTMTVGPARRIARRDQILWRIEITDPFLRVRAPEHGTLVMQGHRQIFDFRRGRPALGENTDRYYLSRWVDTGSAP